MSGRPTVRALVSGDRQAWSPLWRAYLAFYETTRPDAVFDATFARLTDPAEPMWGALAVADGAAVGLVHWLAHRSCWSVADNVYLQDLYVAEAARGRRAGRALIEHVYEAADAMGAAKVYWHTHETNVRARGLYDAVGVRSGFIVYQRPAP